MGDRYEHVCDSCGYRATVSGAPDAGMVAITETMVCSSCRQVVDVLVARHERDGTEPPVAPRCPRCEAGAGSLRSWRTGGACPRCPGAMSIDPGGAFVMWD
jgi:hypothetical protein